jgi:hypothetical protein
LEKNSQRIRLPYPVPYYAQVASPHLAHKIFSGNTAPENDPRWAETGAATPQEYAYWVERACGVACVKMCVEALGGERKTLVEWARVGVASGGYVVERSQGRTRERGWLHSVLAELITRSGFFAQPLPAELKDIVAHLRLGQMVIASVSCEIGDEVPVTRKGGHLVVVVGADLLDGLPNSFILNNPSGRKKALQAGACVPAALFEQGYLGRVIVVGAA